MKPDQIEDQRFYSQVWSEILSKLLGYDKPQINRWIELNCKSWDEHHAVYVSEFPEYWVVDALISTEARQKIGATEVLKLKRDIVDAIELGRPKWASNEAYDWTATRGRLKQLFEKYGIPS